VIGWWRGRCTARTGTSDGEAVVRCGRPRWHRAAHLAWLPDGRLAAVWDR
jgi:hypothetical protein